MDGWFFARDGERTPVALNEGASAFPSDESVAGAPSCAPSQGSRLSSFDDSVADAAWVRDHEGVRDWLRSIPAEQRADFLGRVLANIAGLEQCPLADPAPPGQDTLLSYAILIEYAQHLGVSPTEIGWILENGHADTVDPLLGARVDRMLDDATRRRFEPRRRVEDAAPEIRVTRSISSHWKAGGRRARRTDDTTRARGSNVRFTVQQSGPSTLTPAPRPGRAG